MRDKGKRFLIYCIALSILYCCEVCNNYVFAGYIAADTYSTIIDGNNGGFRQTAGFVSEDDESGKTYDMIPRIESHKFININTDDDGGALSFETTFELEDDDVYGGENYIVNSLFENNKGNNGGAIYSSGPYIPTTFHNVKFLNNAANGDGGAIYAINSVELEDSLLEGNSAKGRGGAVFIKPSVEPGEEDWTSILRLVNTDFRNNSSQKEGGAIYGDFDVPPDFGITNGINIYVDDNKTHYMSGNVQYKGTANESSNAIFMKKGVIDIALRGNGSHLVIDDGIEGANIDDVQLYFYTDDNEVNRKLYLNNEVKNLGLNVNTGTLLLNHGNKLADGMPILNNVDLIIESTKENDATNGRGDVIVDLANNKLDTLNIRNLKISELDLGKFTLALDVDLKEGKSDFFNVAGTASGNIKLGENIKEFNILKDGTSENIQLLSGVGTDFLTGEFKQYVGDDVVYTFTAGENGEMIVLREGPAVVEPDPIDPDPIDPDPVDPPAPEGIGLKEAVNNTEPVHRTYVAIKDVKLSDHLGELGGSSLLVDMKNAGIDGDGHKGIIMAAGQKLEILNGGLLDGSKTIGNFISDTDGAFINNTGGDILIENSYISNNITSGKGGTIFTEGGTITITDSIITNSNADDKGGAIYVRGGAITLNANNSDVIFKDNFHQLKPSETPEVPEETPETPEVSESRGLAAAKAAVKALGIKNDIYIENTEDGTKAALTINGSKNTLFESGIAGNGEIIKNDNGTMKLGGDNSNFTGDVYLNGGTVQLLSGASYFSAQNTFVKNNSRISLINNNPNDVVNFGNLDLDGTAKLGIDIDAKTGLNDKIGATALSGNGKILIDDVNIMSLSPNGGTAKFDIITLDESDNSPLLGRVEMGANANDIITPIYQYSAAFDPATGIMSVAGKKGKDVFNPSILATPVALQAAAQAGVKEAVNYAFEHTDSFTKLPKNERFAAINSNKYAISEFNGQIPLYNSRTEGNAFWFRPYTVFEEIDLDHGPKVDNLSYGTLIGFDSVFKSRNRGWSSTTSSFLGYHGSSLDYSDVDITSNGVLLGLTKNYYKRNFWTALTMSGSVGLGKISEMYGDDDIVHLNGAVSSKTGYNVEFAGGKFIIQPNVSLSYYISKIFDYTNEAGVRINSDPLNSFEVKPGVRLVGNSEGGWQPYLSAAMVWNFFNDTDVRANGIKLPEMSMDPYVEYGLGIQRVVNNDFTCYLQSLVRNGGRTGVSLTGGMSWAVGQKKRGMIHL